MHSSKSADYLVHKGVLADEVGFTVREKLTYFN